MRRPVARVDLRLAAQKERGKQEAADGGEAEKLAESRAEHVG